MAKGGFPRGAAGMNAGGMLRQQAQMQQKIMKMQQDMAKAQEAVEQSSYTASVGGGAVRAVVSGKKELLELHIQPEAVDPAEVEVLQDMVVSAVNEALRQAEEAMNSSMQKLTGGMNLGAFGL